MKNIWWQYYSKLWKIHIIFWVYILAHEWSQWQGDFFCWQQKKQGRNSQPKWNLLEFKKFKWVAVYSQKDGMARFSPSGDCAFHTFYSLMKGNFKKIEEWDETGSGFYGCSVLVDFVPWRCENANTETGVWWDQSFEKIT